MLVFLKCRLLNESSSLHTGSLADRPFWFSSVGLRLKRDQGKARNLGARRRSHLSPHWVESESLESRLACVGVGVQLWWAPGWPWRVCVLRRRFSSDCKKERRALSSSRGEEPSSSTSWISAKVTGCVLKRASRGRRERLLPFAGPFGTGSCWGNSSIADAIRWAGRTWKPEASITIWRTAAMAEQEPSKTKASASFNNFLQTVLICLSAVSYLKRRRFLRNGKAIVSPKSSPTNTPPTSSPSTLWCSGSNNCFETTLVSFCSSVLSMLQLCWCPVFPLSLVFVCVTLSLRLMPQTVPAFSFIAHHYPLSLSLSLTLPSLDLPGPSFSPAFLSVMFPASVAVSPSK